MARKRRRRRSRSRRSNPRRTRRAHRTHARRRHNPGGFRRTTHRRRSHRRRNPGGFMGALKNGGKAILIATGVSIVGMGGMWALGKINTTSTAGNAAKFGITGLVGGLLVGMISPLAGALVGLTFLNVAAGVVLNALTAPKSQPAPTNGLADGRGLGVDGIHRERPQMNAVIADNLGAVFADNLGRLGMSQHAQAILTEGRRRGLSDRQIVDSLSRVVEMRPQAA